MRLSRDNLDIHKDRSQQIRDAVYMMDKMWNWEEWRCNTNQEREKMYFKCHMWHGDAVDNFVFMENNCCVGIIVNESIKWHTLIVTNDI